MSGSGANNMVVRWKGYRGKRARERERDQKNSSQKFRIWQKRANNTTLRRIKLLADALLLFLPHGVFIYIFVAVVASSTFV